MGGLFSGVPPLFLQGLNNYQATMSIIIIDFFTDFILRSVFVTRYSSAIDLWKRLALWLRFFEVIRRYIYLKSSYKVHHK